MEIKVKAKRWGSSLGVILPKAVVDAKRIKENDEIFVSIERERPKMGEMFGLLKGKLKKSGQEIKDEAKRGWESNSDRERNKEWK